MSKFKVGQEVMWRGSWGRDLPVRAVISSEPTPVKGEVAYSLDNGHWAYTYQLEAIKGASAMSPRELLDIIAECYEPAYAHGMKGTCEKIEELENVLIGEMVEMGLAKQKEKREAANNDN